MPTSSHDSFSPPRFSPLSLRERARVREGRKHDQIAPRPKPNIPPAPCKPLAPVTQCHRATRQTRHSKASNLTCVGRAQTSLQRLRFSRVFNRNANVSYRRVVVYEGQVGALSMLVRKKVNTVLVRYQYWITLNLICALAATQNVVHIP